VTIVDVGVNGADGIEIDVSGGKLYWAELGGLIRRANIDGTGLETIEVAGGEPHSVALDVAAGKVYWTELANSRICRSNLNGTNVQVVISTPSPDGLAIDPAGGKIYWSRGNRVRRANTNGTGSELLYATTDPHGIALDVAAGKIYWTSFGNNTIERGDMDGSGAFETLVSGLATPLAVALDLIPGKMYWTELGGGGSIKRANLNGSQIETVLDAEVSGPFGLTIVATGPAPVPALSEVGLFALTGLLLVGGAVLIAKRSV
jgi:low density lipoprotein receptor-related protein 5/6